MVSTQKVSKLNEKYLEGSITLTLYVLCSKSEFPTAALTSGMKNGLNALKGSYL